MNVRTRCYWLAIALIGVGMALAGCVPIGYVYPVLTSTPPVPVGAKAGEVYAFRVDDTEEWEDIEYPYPEVVGIPLPRANRRYAVDSYTLQRIHLTDEDRVTEQSLMAFDYGWLWHRLIVSDSGRTEHRMTVRLYRPGWKTVEIREGQTSEPIRWQEAPDVEAQERAVDDLLVSWKKDGHDQAEKAVPGIGGLEDTRQASGRTLISRIHSLAPGSASKAHKKALLFAADEYERLAGFVTDAANKQARAQLEQKASTLRQLAAQ